MKYDIILAGVGGQGILTIAYLLDTAAINRGLRFKQAEVHGMAQRGGAVYSHMRISDSEIISDLIPEGRADMILSVEPLEVHRYLNMLSDSGVVVSNIAPVINIPDYPDEKTVIDGLYALPRPIAVDAGAIAAEAGVPKAENMAMVGAATAYLPFTLEDYAPIISTMFASKGEQMVEANMRVLNNGLRVGMFTRLLMEAGVSGDTACRFVARVKPETLDSAKVAETAVLLKGPKAAAMSAADEKTLEDFETVVAGLR